MIASLRGITRAQLARALPDALGLALAFAYGLPALLYRVGHDQSMFFYIGREWLRGSIPFRDAFDVKPPGIYALFAASIALFGEHQWSPRLAELLAVVASGVMLALVVRRDSPHRPGEVGAAALLVSSYYYTLYDHWDTTQAEFSEAFFLLAALFAIERGARVPSPTPRRLDASALLGGGLAGFSALIKPTGALVGVILGLVVIEHRVRLAQSARARCLGALRGGAAYTLGVALAFALTLGYFAAHGAMQALRDLAGYLVVYRNWPSYENGPANSEAYWLTRGGMWHFVYLGGALIALWRRASRRHVAGALGALTAIAMAVAAGASVALQGKWFWYHWGAVVPFIALLGVYGLAELRSGGAAVALALTFLVGGFVSGPRWVNTPALSYYLFVKDVAWEHAMGRRSARSVSSVFNIGSYHFGTNERVALRIRAMARPGDMLHVRSFEPTLYVVSGMRTPTRFPSEYPLEAPGLEYHREAWLAERDRVIYSRFPRFLVTYTDRPADIADLEAHGYRQGFSDGPFLVMIHDRAR